MRDPHTCVWYLFHHAVTYFDHVYPVSAVTCPVLEPPENGQVIQSGNTPTSMAQYQCNGGYNLQSGVSSSRTCGSDGQWSGVAPVCEGISI